jgi:DNA modification methylase
MSSSTKLQDDPKGLWQYLPVRNLPNLSNAQSALPAIAKDRELMAKIESGVRQVPTNHRLLCHDSRLKWKVDAESVALVLTSPPYWTLKEYREHEGQLGFIADYNEFHRELDKVWRNCFRALMPGGRLICVVGDVCLSRRMNNGRHTVVPLHATIQERCRKIGFDNLAPIIWYKIANASYEAEGNGAGFLGKPYEPGAVIKNDIEYILMLRKPGGYRKPSLPERVMSVISADNYQLWFQQILSGVTGASTRNHPAPYPVELAERLIRMFSFVGDTVLDPFSGTASTSVGASRWGRNSIGIELDPHYFEMGKARLDQEARNLFACTTISDV